MTKIFTASTICANIDEKKGAQRGSRARNVDVAHVMGDVDDYSLKEKLEKCKHFLVDGEIENGRHSLQLCHGYSAGTEKFVGKNFCLTVSIVLLR